MFRPFSAVLAATLLITAPFAWGQTPIEKIAPENTVILVGMKNVAATTERFKGTGLWALWEDEKIKSLRADQMKMLTEEINKHLEELGVEKDSLVPPTGGVGLAVFPVINEDTGQPAPTFILTADYGANADKTDALVQAAIARGEKDGELDIDRKDVAGRTIHSIDFSKLKKKMDEAQGGDEKGMDAMDLPPGVPNPAEIMEGWTKFHYVRDGSTLMLSNNVTSVTDALDAVDGKGGKNITERTEFQSIVEKLGEADLHAVILTRDAMQLMPDGGAEMAMGLPMVRAAFGHVHGYGFGMRVDGPNGMIEQTIIAHMPDGKAGLTSLVDSPLPGSPLPAFVSPETISYVTFNFELGGLMGAIRKFVDANPFLAGQAQDQLNAMEEPMRRLAADLGTQMHIAISETKPYSDTSRKTVMAAQCVNAQDFENMIADLAAQIGLEARDFLGQRIYSMKPEMMGMMPMPMSEPFSLGIGGGYVLVGPTAGVEQALRASSQTGGANLTSEPNFQRATSAVPHDSSSAWGYSNTVDIMESTIRSTKAQQMKMIAEIREFDAEYAAEQEKQLQETFKFFESIDFELLRKYIGPSAWQVRSTDDGFVMQSSLLPAAGAK